MTSLAPDIRRGGQRGLGWALLGALVLSLSCTTKQELAAQLERATQQQHLPEVAACWERAFEAAGFEGSYEAVVDFTISAKDGTIRDAVVATLDQQGEETPASRSVGRRLRRCVEQALNRSNLAAGGMTPASDVQVTGFRIAFSDASADARRAATENASHVLIGPRTDRCDGLYAHEPPRRAAVLHAELAQAQAAADELESAERDDYARALQKTYDLALELVHRLEHDAEDDELSTETRQRTNEEIERTLAIAKKSGKLIGCRVRGGR